MNEQTLYLECYSGISGDMTVAALLDLGADEKSLLEGLQSLKVDGYQIKIGRKAKNSIDACDFDVILTSNPHHHIGHDHGHDNHEHNEHEHSDHKHNVHEHNDHEHNDHKHIDYKHNHHTHDDHNHIEHSHNDHSHHKHHHHSSPALSKSSSPHLVLGHHEHRNLSDINSIIDQSSISNRAKELAKHIFLIIAEAEAKAHAKPLDEVHFHEVGAIDSIVDIVAAAICLDNLNITEVIVSELYEGTGQIMCQHGLLPIPVPAVVNIASAHQLPLHITDVKGELVTPTGAAIVAAIKTRDALPKDFRIQKIGLGAGKRNYSGASGILRAMLIETAPMSVSADKTWVLEANIDDCTGEALAFAMELLFQKGARDVYYTPIFMKKNRPAYLVGVICSEELIPAMEHILFTHTTTIGIRRHEVERTVLPREVKTIMTPYGEAKVKVCHYGERTFHYPEYDSVKALSLSSGQDYMSVYDLVKSLAKENWKSDL